MTHNSGMDEPGRAGVRRLIGRATEIAGGASANVAGVAVGFLLGGLEGAAVGGAATTAVSMTVRGVGQELSCRLLSPREEARIGYVYTLAAAEIADRLQDGQQVRTDGFFEETPMGRSDGAEVWESVLLKSQREPEEMKLPYMAHLLANITFDTRYGVHIAHQITKACDQLTYRQLCIMKLVSVNDQYHLKQEDYRRHGVFAKDLYQILYEYLDLYSKGYIYFGGNVALGLTDIKPGSAVLQGIGEDIFNLMQLWEIPAEDLRGLAMQLQ